MLCHELWVFYDWSSNKHCYHFTTALLSPPPPLPHQLQCWDSGKIADTSFEFWMAWGEVLGKVSCGCSLLFVWHESKSAASANLSMIVVTPVLHREKASKVDTVFIICQENHTMWLQVNHQPEMRCYTPLLSDPPKIEIQNIKIFMKYFNENKWTKTCETQK